MPVPASQCIPLCGESPCMFQKMAAYNSAAAVQQPPETVYQILQAVPHAEEQPQNLAFDWSADCSMLKKMLDDVHTSCVSCRSQGELMEERILTRLNALERPLEQILSHLDAPFKTNSLFKTNSSCPLVDYMTTSNITESKDPEMNRTVTSQKKRKGKKLKTMKLRNQQQKAKEGSVDNITGTQSVTKAVTMAGQSSTFTRAHSIKAAFTGVTSIKGDPGICEYIAKDPKFDAFCAIAVVLNSALVGMQVNQEAEAADEHAPEIYNIMEYVFTAFFTLELLIRILGLRRKFFARGETWWACFDILLVAFSWIDIALELIFKSRGKLPGPGASVGKMLKMARMARIMRVVRMVRFLTKIRIMVAMIIGSMASLFWLLVLLCAVMYIFGILLTQGATMWLKPGDGYTPPTSDAKYSLVRMYFGSVPRTIYTLFMSMSGGVSWGEPADVSQAYGWVFFLIFVYYVFFTIFSVMNIVTGVFVDGAIQQAESDRSVIVQKQLAQKQEVRETLEDILCQLDKDEDGCLSKAEWDAVFSDSHIKATLSGLQVNVEEAEDLWDMLDVDGNGAVDILEFVDGMMRLKGYAKAIDIERLLCRVNEVDKHVRVLYDTWITNAGTRETRTLS